MRLIFILLLLFLIFSSSAYALSEAELQKLQKPGDVLGDVLNEPLCFYIINDAPYDVGGTFSSNYYVTEEGVNARHRSNFYLQIDEMSQFCVLGPFYPGHKIELTLRTLIPIFSCKTKIDGNIRIKGQIDEDDNYKTWAECR